MKAVKLLPILAIALAAVAGGCQHVEGQTGGASYQAKSNRGDVAFELTPRGIVDGRFVVDFRVDTHSGDLSEINLEEAVTLEVGESAYKAAEASSLRGHHAQGTLVFALTEAPENFTIVIAHVRDMGDLRFEWSS